MRARGLTVLAGVLGLALVGVLAAGGVLGSRAVAADLEPRVLQALVDAGLSDVAVTVQGREVELVPVRSRDLVPAIDVVEDVEGVRWARLDPSLDVDDLRPDLAYVELGRDGSELRIAGAVRDASSAAALKAAAASTFATTVRGDVRVDPELPAAPWTEVLPALLPDLAALKGLDLEVRDGTTLELSGSIESAAGRDRVIETIRAAVPDLDVEPAISVDPGTLSLMDAELLNDFRLEWAPPPGLSDADLARVEAIADVLVRNPGVSVRVDGHVGPEGTEGRDSARAQVARVEDALVEYGVQPGRIAVRTYAIAARPDAEPRTRRVEIVVREE